MATTPETPTSVRELNTPAALELAELTAVLDDLHTVLRCCERLLADLARQEPDDLVIEALWSTALLSYNRCFTTDVRSAALTEADLEATSLRGEVTEWHAVLGKLCEHYTNPAANPRERFSVGAARDEHGAASGIAITSIPQPRLDETTVQQTGALAYQLTQQVERRIAERQAQVHAATAALTSAELDQLPRIDLTAAEHGPGLADG
ncbi:hypothetical protein [Sciscionella marina]|uniref:hypothetical protein n=1 Tax=Sciscionella marina TaxID=508770 RepID=UPI00035F8D29|nr:hypothetical protein [Sciscionella marina]